MPVWPDPSRKEVQNFLDRIRGFDASQWTLVAQRYGGSSALSDASFAARDIIAGNNLAISDEERQRRLRTAQKAYDEASKATSKAPENVRVDGDLIPVRAIAQSASEFALDALMARPDLRLDIARMLLRPFGVDLEADT